MGFFLDLIETDWVCLIVLIALGEAANICGFLDYFLVFLLSFGVSKIIDIYEGSRPKICANLYALLEEFL
jgi:hypothetical protein